MPKQSPALVAHREMLASTKAAVAKWALDNGGSDAVATSILTLLADCADDTNGDQTLDALEAIFDEHDAVIPQSLALHFTALTNAAHTLGRSGSTVKDTRVTPIRRKNPGLLGLTDEQQLYKVTRRRITAVRSALDDVERALAAFAADPSEAHELDLHFAIQDAEDELSLL